MAMAFEPTGIFSKMSDDFKTSKSIWKDLEAMRDDLRSCGQLDLVKSFINENLGKEVDEIKKMFHEEFDHLPNDDLLKFEVLQMLAEIGIKIYR
jgi:hypothetical protein